MRTKLAIFSAIMFLVAMGTADALDKTVGPSGSGANYITDGVQDEYQINQALTAVYNAGGGTVYLIGSNTYRIDATSIKIGSNTTLRNSGSGVIVKLKDSAGWAKDVPIITSISTGMTNITVYGFEVNGNAANNWVDDTRDYGQDYFDCLYFKNCTNVSVHDMYLHHNLNDGLCTSGCRNVDYYNNTIYLIGHDGYYGYNSTNVDVYGNNVTIHTNSGIRLDATDDARIYQNILHTPSGGGGNAGVQIACATTRIIDSVSVYENTIYDTNYAGMWIYSSTNAQTGSIINVYNNTLYNCGVSNSSYAGGIVTCGFNMLIERNTFYRSHGAAVSTRDTYASGNPAGGPYYVTVRNNIITSSRSTTSGAGAGYGIWNSLSTMHNPMKNQNNCYYANAGTNYYGSNITPTVGIVTSNPQFADTTTYDFHLKSTYSGGGRWNGSSWVTDSVHSPCIDAGYSTSGYASEPEPNGNQVNMGRWANTIYASKSIRGYKPVAAEQTPSAFSLGQNVPNPFNPATTITYTVASEGLVTLKVYSANGQLVETLVDGVKNPGSYNVTWKPANLASGVYFCRLQAGDFAQTKRMLFMK